MPRCLLISLFLLCLQTVFSPFKNKVSAQTPITVTDIRGRTVTLEEPAERILLGEGRYLLALSLIEDQPTKRIAGWMGDFRYLGDQLYKDYKQQFPGIDEIPIVGKTGEETFSIEKALSVKPDLAIFAVGGHGPGAASKQTLAQLEAAGIPVVFLDFRQKPFEHTIPSMRVLGMVTGQQEKAEAYIQLYQKHLDRISNRLAEQEGLTRPKVFLHMHAGAFNNCCSSPGADNLGRFIELAGGQNIGAEVIPGALGTLSIEYILTENPDVYIGTGVEPSIRDQGIAMGTGVTAETAQATLNKVLNDSHINAISAIQNNRIHGFWHNFYNSPVNLLAAEVMAKWIHPDLFDDLDPNATLKQLNEEFMAVPMEGTYWFSNQ